MAWGSDASAAAAPGDKIFIGDINPTLTEQTVKEVFNAFGNVSDFRYIAPKMPGAKAACIIKFGTVDEAKWIVENVNGNVPAGMQEPVVVKYYSQSGWKG